MDFAIVLGLKTEAVNDVTLTLLVDVLSSYNLFKLLNPYSASKEELMNLIME